MSQGMDETLVSSTAPDVELHPLACKRLLVLKAYTVHKLAKARCVIVYQECIRTCS